MGISLPHDRGRQPLDPGNTEAYTTIPCAPSFGDDYENAPGDTAGGAAAVLSSPLAIDVQKAPSKHEVLPAVKGVVVQCKRDDIASSFLLPHYHLESRFCHQSPRGETE